MSELKVTQISNDNGKIIMAGDLDITARPEKTMDGNLHVNGLVSSNKYMGLFKPYSNIVLNKTFQWTVTSRTSMTISVGLEGTNAKFVAASVFAYDYHGSSAKDHVNHLFGYDLPSYSSWCQDGAKYYIDNTDDDPSTYVVVTHNGDSAGSDYYGIHQFIIIPLYAGSNGEPAMDILLGDGLSSGSHDIKMRIIGYFE